MGLLMLAGLFGTLGYMGYFAKQETTAMIGDTKIKPINEENADKKTIKDNFKLICKRGNVKLDKNGYPIYKKHRNPCIAYLEYQGFQQSAVKYFEELYLEKYNKKYKNKRQEIEDKHWWLEQRLYDEYDKKEIKIFRHPYWGNAQSKCDKLMQNWLWSHMVTHYNIVRDGSRNIEVWSISAPPVILKQIDTIYDEVCFLEGIYKEN